MEMLQRPKRPAPPLFEKKTLEAPTEPDLVQEYLRKPIS